MGVKFEEGFSLKTARETLHKKLTSFRKFALLYKLKLPTLATKIFFYNYLNSKIAYHLVIFEYLPKSYKIQIG